MRTHAMFGKAKAAAGMYESFYLRAVAPEEPVGAWIRYTVHKRPGSAPTGSVWCTVFDARRGAPFMHKTTSAELSVPGDAGWIEIGDRARIGPSLAEGTCGPASWSLRYASPETGLEHLRPALLYRSPLPRTKLTSPMPLARFEGTVDLPDRETLRLDGWRGMIGHNWGAEHAERWIWLHGCLFEGRPDAWLDLALGRIELAGRMTPWVANGVVSLEGARHRLGGLIGRSPRVAETPAGCSVTVPASGGTSVELNARIPPGTAAGWRYADPDGEEHDVVNCSVATLEMTVSGLSAENPQRLVSPHGGVYELGMRERDHGVALAPFADG